MKVKSKSALWFILLMVMIKIGFSVAPLKLEVGEYQKYDVRYLHIYLGSLRFRIEEKLTMHQRTVYKCKFKIDSNPSLPFVTIHDVYYTYLDSVTMASHKFLAYEHKGEDTIFTRYEFDYDKKSIDVFIQRWTPNGRFLEMDSVFAIPDSVTHLYDSVSLLYFARHASIQKQGIDVHVFAYNTFSTTRIEFTGELKKFKHKELEYNKGYYLFGKMKFVGIAGIKEDFKGWFSIDPQRIPLKAYMKAFIGKVSIQLDEWEKWGGEHIYLNHTD